MVDFSNLGDQVTEFSVTWSSANTRFQYISVAKSL